MEPSQVRERILEDHRGLEVRLDRIVSLAGRVQGGEDATSALRHEVGGLVATLLEHMALEDEILVPALLDADAWGDVRNAQLAGHHEIQRAELDGLLGALRSPTTSPARQVELVLKLVDDLRADIRREEKELLDPYVLRDDLITGGISS